MVTEYELTNVTVSDLAILNKTKVTDIYVDGVITFPAGGTEAKPVNFAKNVHVNQNATFKTAAEDDILYVKGITVNVLNGKTFTIGETVKFKSTSTINLNGSANVSGNWGEASINHINL